MPTYRIDLAPTGRAGCTNKECKDNKVKITKGDVRVGSWVDTEKYQSFMWRHWGCVTPKMISNMIEVVGEGDDRDLDLLDGYEDLPQEHQEKLARALDQGHIDDEDWNGDLELNRPGKHGFRVRGGKKKAAKAAEEEEQEKEEKENEEKEQDEGSEEEPKESKNSTKRSRLDVEENEDEEKKPRSKRKATGYPKYVPPASDEDGDDEDEEPVPAKAKTKAARRGKAKNEDAASPAAKRAKRAKKNDDEAEDEPVAEKPKRGRRKKAT
ncbi:hypothetical protein BJX62DRAFT_193079 [Aspergillus germanicus]